MSARWLASAGCALVLALAWAGPAQAALAPGLFRGIPPTGRVMADTSLTRPPGTPKGFVVLIHGGGWIFTGPALLAPEAPTVASLASLGWGVYDVDYRPGWFSVVDVVAAYDHLRRLHPRAPICALGQSAGGQLAMLLAASRPRLRCVISEAGITDLREIPLADPLHVLIEHVFHGRPWEFSPVRLAADIHGTLLCAGSSFDQLVPEPEQLEAIKRVRPKTITMLLAGAPTPNGPSFAHPPNFVHASVTPAAALRFRRALERTLAQAVAAG